MMYLVSTCFFLHLFCVETNQKHSILLKTQDNIKDLGYWLSPTSTLLFLLQSTIKASGSPYKSLHRNRGSPTTLFGRMTQKSLFNLEGFYFVVLGIILLGAGFGYWLVRKYIISEDGEVDVGVAITCIILSTKDTPLAMATVGSYLGVYYMITKIVRKMSCRIYATLKELSLALKLLMKQQLLCRFALDIDLDAPKIRIPIRLNASSKYNSHFRLDFGHFTLRKELLLPTFVSIFLIVPSLMPVKTPIQLDQIIKLYEIKPMPKNHQA
ncbi:unnamed protein product [Lactuca virosa]|uniref:Uncharacterized protein n=1 Tax=Lactuca virosa TaxID=75947 RepID=A0AAU9PCK6_9ASTR|nr:unnamed protein product [Lactuca virosa]